MGLGGGHSVPDAKSSCIEPLENRMARCHRNLEAVNQFVDGFDSLIRVHGEYTLFNEYEGVKLYAVAVLDQKRLKAEWKALKKELKKNKKTK